jgi:hypothetical protein
LVAVKVAAGAAAVAEQTVAWRMDNAGREQECIAMLNDVTFMMLVWQVFLVDGVEIRS